MKEFMELIHAKICLNFQLEKTFAHFFFCLGQASWAMHDILSFAMHGLGRSRVTHLTT